MEAIDYIVEFNDYNEFERVCAEGTPLEVIIELKEANLDKTILEVEHDWLIDDDFFYSPVEAACCNGGNPAVVRLFLMLGLQPGTNCTCDYSRDYTTFGELIRWLKPHRLMKFLPSVIPTWDREDASFCSWWTHKYTREKNSSLQDKMEELIMRGEFSEILWIGLRGGRLLRPDILASKEFEEASPLMRKLVWLLLVPDDVRRDYQRWLPKNGPDTYGLLPHEKTRATAKEIFQKLLLSWELFASQDMLLESLTTDDKILLLKYLSEKVCRRGWNWIFARKLHPILCNDILLKSWS